MPTKFIASGADVGKRLDHFLHEKMPQYSRSRIQSWVKTAKVVVNGVPARSSLLLRTGDAVETEPGDLPPLRAEPEALPLEVLYEDSAVIAVNKPAGMVVHAGAGNHSGTLVNGLLYRFGALSQLGGELRPGIVHRLDRYTSGVLLVAKTNAAHQALAAQFLKRSIRKSYIALVHGHLRAESGDIRAPITRDPARRMRMTARLGIGREAITYWKVKQRFAKFTLLEVSLGTGRTHQIRAHFKSIGHAIAGDKVYGAPAHRSGRFFLHACQIAFRNPATNQTVTVSAPLPEELEQWLKEL